jgi:hypothetical protein
MIVLDVFQSTRRTDCSVVFELGNEWPFKLELLQFSSKEKFGLRMYALKRPRQIVNYTPQESPPWYVCTLHTWSIHVT